jgi:hypothetical protein
MNRAPGKRVLALQQLRGGARVPSGKPTEASALRLPGIDLRSHDVS